MLPLPSRIEVAVRRMAQVAPADHLRRIGKALAPLDSWSPGCLHRVQEAVAAPSTRRLAGELCALWKGECPEVPGATLATALSIAAAVQEDSRNRVKVEPVWTGPKTAAVPVRLTSAVLADLIRGCESSLLIVSYATYHVSTVFEEVLRAAARGVHIRMIAETDQDGAGRGAGPAVAAFSQVPGLEMYAWPSSLRPAVGTGVAAMHVKAAVADSMRALIGSANLTVSAQAHNMELGVLVTGGELPGLLVRHFTELISKGILVRK